MSCVRTEQKQRQEKEGQKEKRVEKEGQAQEVSWRIYIQDISQRIYIQISGVHTYKPLAEYTHTRHQPA